ncbi:MAG: hypothetical protein DI536_04330 [Archangium gephyra]|uniref:Protein gp37 n=1 Tax=Archangium gephyra TaxID=48 RepID=A0A2W5TU31_9BACT|nr:MAG: hypothetical protein DI536_04330 [Archangium gephyra]
MGENSGIQWTTHTFNPWVGCQRVSPGCTNCYAETYDKRVGGGVDPADGKKKLRWGPLAPRVSTARENWNKPEKWNRAAAAAGERHRVFCSSLADVFEDRPELVPRRAQLFRLIEKTPNLDWLLLTKRPQNIRRMLTETAKLTESAALAAWHLHDVPMPNVWFGTTVEDQQRANERVPELLKVPAVVRFLSCEPLLERVVLPRFCLCGCGKTVETVMAEPSPLNREQREDGMKTGLGIDWIIIGGESGQKARPFDLSWARELVQAARVSGAAPFVKQLGAVPVVDESEWRVGNERGLHLLSGAPHARKSAPAGTVPLKFNDAHAGEPAEWPEDLRVREFPEPRR